jgi:lipopolysaccharide export system protein LptC
MTTRVHPRAGALMSGDIAPARSQSRRVGFGQISAATGFHTRLVRVLKLALPVIAGALVLLVAAWPHLNQRDDRFKIGVSNVSLEEAATVRMVKPRFTGLDAANRPFVLTADDATQMQGDSNVVQLQLPKGDVTLTDGTWVALTGESGNYYKDLQVLDLFGHVNMFHDAGYEFRTQTARFELNASKAEGNDPVEGQGPFGTINAQGFRIIDKGAIVHFLGKSRLVIRRDLMAAPQ